MGAQEVDRIRARRVVGKEPDRHPARAERDGCRDLGQLVGPGRDLEGAAADVEQQDLPGCPAEPPPDGQESEASLGVAAQHLQRLTQRGLDAGDHRGPVLGFAHR